MVVKSRQMKLLSCALILAMVLVLLLQVGSRVAQGQASSGYIRQVQVLETEKTGLSYPVGLAFSKRANGLKVVEGRSPGQPESSETEVIQLNGFGHRTGSARFLSSIENPLNLTSDPQAGRLLAYHQAAHQLLTVSENAAGQLEPATLKRHDARSFGLRNPRGMSVDGQGRLWILDADGSRLVRVTPDANGSFSGAQVVAADVQLGEAEGLRGLAYDPRTSHLQVLNGKEHKLYELSQTGQVLITRDLTEFDLLDPQGMSFAPSGDQTDDLAEVSLFVADGATGQIVELSLSEPIAAAASAFTPSLVRTTNLAAISPPSPDPAGLTYIPSRNTLLVSDSEVEETVNGITHFMGANVWELTLRGGVVSTANISKVAPTVVPMTNEPTGVAWNTNNNHVFVSADDGDSIFDLNPGADGKIGTADDRWTRFDTLVAGSGDAEGVAYDSLHDEVFVVDGVNAEVYRFTSTGTPLGHFDVAVYGVQDPESVEFNPDTGTLFVLGNRSCHIIVETTTSGSLIGTYDFAAAGARKPAGLAYAPASDGSGLKRFYIVDRGVDNNTDPNIIDGKMYEMTAPASTAPENMVPVVNAGVDQTITLPGSATLDGTVSDDGLPNPPGIVTTTWSKVSGPGTVTFANPSSVDTTASFSVAGSYVLRLTASDSSLSTSDDVTITVNSVPNSAPVATNGSLTTAEDTPGSITLTASDNDGDPLTYNVVTQPAHGTLSGTLPAQTYTPAANYNGADSFTFKANDGKQDSNIATVTITVTPVNDPPVAVDDSAVTSTGTAVTIAVLSNDSDVDQDPLTVTSVTSPANGTATIQSGGSILYTPTAGYAGLDSFTYSISDGHGGVASANVTLTVVPFVNYAPLVNAGVDQTITLPGSATLDGTVSDDGLPNPPGIVTTTWSKVSGPGTVTFANPSSVVTTATFLDVGTYILRLTASDGELTSSDDITIKLVPDLIYKDSFESGNLSAWSSSIIDRGHLSVTASAALVGTYGLQAYIADNKSMYVTDLKPEAEPHYRARFYFNPNSIGMAAGNAHYIFCGYDASGTTIFQVEFRYSGTAYQIRVRLYNDSHSVKSAAWYNINNRSQSIEIDWRAATAVAANNGGLTLWIDGIQISSLTGVDSDTHRIESIRLGAVSGVDTGTRGMYYFDEFESRRLNYIGP